MGTGHHLKEELEYNLLEATFLSRKSWTTRKQSEYMKICPCIPGKPVTKALRLKTSKRSQIRTHLGGDDIVLVS